MKNITRLLIVTMLVGSFMIPLQSSLADNPVILSIDNITVPADGSAQALIHLTDVVNLGSFMIAINYDPAVVTPTSVADQDLIGVNSYINNASHIVSLNWYTTGSVSGDKVLAAITFTPAAQANSGDSCPLVLTGDLYDNTPAGNSIPHSTQNGTAVISGQPSGNTVLSIDNITVPLGGTAQGLLHLTNVNDLGSFQITVGYDPAVVTPTNVEEKDLAGLSYYINNASHIVSLNWYTTGSVSGDKVLAAITFTPAAQANSGDSCSLVLTADLYDSTPAGDSIVHSTRNGIATISGGTLSTTLSINDITVPLGGTANGCLRIDHIQNLGSLDVTVGYDPDVVIPVQISEKDLTGISFYIDEINNAIRINWYTTGSVSGNYSIACIKFEPAASAQAGDSCPLTVSGDLYDDTPAGNSIAHATDSGTAVIAGGPSGGTILSMDDVSIPISGTAHGLLRLKNVNGLGSFDVSLGYDPAVVTPTAVVEKDLSGLNYYINTAAHTISLNWYTTGSESGDFSLATITFAPASQASVGDSCSLTVNGELYDDTPIGNPISHSTDNGVATIVQQGGGGGSGGGGTTGNTAPTAHFTMSETSAMVGTSIKFDASSSVDPDHDTLTYKWDFGDGTTSTLQVVYHTFTTAKTYAVKLTVNDGKGGIDDETKAITIVKGNNPPADPTVQGTFTGHKNAPLSFSMMTTDADNDNLVYTIMWGDGQTTTTDSFASGITVTQSHTWAHAGKYTMMVSASDGTTTSGTTTSTVLIDVKTIENLGYLIDSDGDGVYDGCYVDSLQSETMVQLEGNGSYLIDKNGDHTWDYIYNPTTATLVPFTLATIGATGTDYNLLLLIGFVAIVVLIVVYIAFRHSKRSSKK